MSIYCFDLDHTLCVPTDNHSSSETKYGDAEPITEIINLVNNLHKNGNKIIIHTSRRMLTHEGNVRKVEEDIREITESWLERHQVRYDDIIFGKPYADFYVDDKAINVSDFLEG